MNETANTNRLQSMATGYLAVALLSAVLFEMAYLFGYFGTGGRTPLSITLYTVNLLVISTAVLILWWLYHEHTQPVVLLIGLACLSWFLGILFYTSYVFILGEILRYPSVGQVAFQGFHLLSIPVFLFLLERAEVSVWRPSFIPAVGFGLVPIVTYLTVGTELNVALYNVFYLFVVLIALALSAHLLYAGVVPLLGAGFSLFFLTDIVFISITLTVRDPAIYFLHPLWFSAYALIAFGAVRYTYRGELTSGERT